jgi:bifunctional UDP-N-acetylglucosamine pyrophosphorylase/glucosamine-1-phosphate N-acetyltransferase
MKKDLVAVILAGGTGTRFWPLSTDKMLFPFMGKPLFSHTVIDNIPREIDRVVIVANNSNYKSLQSFKYPFPHTVVIQQSPSGIADALLTAGQSIFNTSILVMIADHMIEGSLYQRLIKKALSTRGSGIIAGWIPERYFPGGYLKIDGNRVIGIVEKPDHGTEPSQYVNIAEYIEDANLLLEQIKKTSSENDDIFEKALSSLASRTNFFLEPYKGISSSLKYPWNVLDVMNDLLCGKIKEYRGKNTVIKDYVTIEGPVYIGNNVKILECTKIVGPCYIGDNTIIGNNNIIRVSQIGENCVTGFGTDITRSYIGDGCWFHSNYIGDSVLEGNVCMGSGSVMANLRLAEDEIFSTVRNSRIGTMRNKLGAVIGRNVKIGINSSLMPGIKIGMSSFIGAGSLIIKDVPEYSFAYSSPGMTVKPNTGRSPGTDRELFRKKLA